MYLADQAQEATLAFGCGRGSGIAIGVKSAHSRRAVSWRVCLLCTAHTNAWEFGLLPEV